MTAKEGGMKEVSDKFSDVIIPVSAYLFTCKSHENSDYNNSIKYIYYYKPGNTASNILILLFNPHKFSLR